jgi:hypothetical protein
MKRAPPLVEGSAAAAAAAAGLGGSSKQHQMLSAVNGRGWGGRRIKTRLSLVAAGQINGRLGKIVARRLPRLGGVVLGAQHWNIASR